MMLSSAHKTLSLSVAHAPLLLLLPRSLLLLFSSSSSSSSSLFIHRSLSSFSAAVLSSHSDTVGDGEMGKVADACHVAQTDARIR